MPDSPIFPLLGGDAHLGSIHTEDVFHGGFADYNDGATAITPIAVNAATPTFLTNDAAGAFTNEAYLPFQVTTIWDETNDCFDWTQLKLGDMIDIRLDIEVTTSGPNQSVKVWLQMADGTGGTYAIPFEGAFLKTTGAYDINRFNGIYMGDTNSLNNPAKFMIESDASCDVVVRGWYCKIIRRGE